MGGDQGNGLAMAIGIVMLLMVLGAVALFFLIGRALTRKMAPGRRGLVVLLVTVAGLGAGWLAIMMTFYESIWSPPPQLRIVTPPGFSQPWVILLEDPRAAQVLTVRESRLPFTATTAEVNVPASGIARVRDLSAIAGRMDLQLLWPEGVRDADPYVESSAGGGPAPSGTGARSYLIMQHPSATPAPDDLMALYDAATFAAYVAEKEGRR